MDTKEPVTVSKTSSSSLSRMITSGIVRSTVVVCLLLSNLGCGQDGGNGAGGAAANGRPSTRRVMTPDQLTGLWKLTFAQGRFFEFEGDMALLRLSNDDKTPKLELVELEKHFDKGQLKTTKVTDDGQVQLEFELGSQTFSFEGQADGEVIWGSLMVPHLILCPAKMVRTEESHLPKESEGRPVADAQRFMDAVKSGDPYVSLHELTQSAHNSPLLFGAYTEMAMKAKKEKLSEDEVRQLVEKYHQSVACWGTRLAPRADLDIANALAQQQLYPELAKTLIAQADEKIPANYPGDLQVQLSDAWYQLGNYEKSESRIKPLYDEYPHDPLIIFVHARNQVKLNQADKALADYLKLAAIPGAEAYLANGYSTKAEDLPTAVATRLWKDKHGNTDGYDVALSKAYAELIKGFVPQRKQTTAPAEGAHVVLLELFTGSSCAPCVAADLACEAMQAAFPKSELVVVRYHEHNPTFDPLCGQHSFQRYQQYQIEGARTVVVDGALLPGVAGSYQNVPGALQAIALELQKRLKPEPGLQIKLEVTRSGESVKVTAKVSNLTDLADKPRLYLLVVEDEIDFLAPNGIRRHDAIARRFLNDLAGFELKPDALEHSVEFQVDGLRVQLSKDLEELEKQESIQFSVKPLDLKKLRIVAFIQNSTNAKVFQTTTAPVPDP